MWGVIWCKDQSHERLDSAWHHYLQRIKQKGSLNCVNIKVFAGSGCLFFDADANKPESHALANTDTTIFSGELSNRKQLVEELSLSRECLGSDARLAAEGFAKAGKALFLKLTGAYSLIIYDHDSDTLLLVTDRQGDKRLYYQALKDAVIVSSSLETLVSTSLVNRIADRQSVAGYFANHTPYTSRSYIQQVSKVIPGHYVRISDAGETVEQYWRFELLAGNRDASNEELKEAFLTHLGSALERSMSQITKTAILLSGGLDSCSIMAMLMQAESRATDILAVTHVFDKYQQCDERRYLDALSKRYGFNHLYVNVDDCLPLACDPETLHSEVDTIWVPPMIWQRRKSYPIIKSRGYDHFLTGEFGDHLFGAYRYWLRDLITSGQPVGEKLKAVRHQIGISKMPWINDSVIRRILPFNGITAGRLNRFPKFLTPYSRNAVRQMSKQAEQYDSRFERDRYQGCLNQNSSDLSLLIRNEAQRYGLQPLFVFRDFNLINFTLNLPACQFYDYSNREHKHILRQSMAEKLPDAIRLRTGATVYNAIFRDSLTRAHVDTVKEILLDPARSWSDYVNEDILLALIGRDDASDSDLHLIWNCLCYEMWNRRLMSV